MIPASFVEETPPRCYALRWPFPRGGSAFPNIRVPRKKVLLMMRSMLVAVSLLSLVAFAQTPAPAKAEAKPAAAPAKAETKPAAVAMADCDMHKAQAAMMKDVQASKAKVEMVKLDTGTSTIITADKKSSPAVEKAFASMETPMKDAMEGKAKLCEECQNTVAAMKAGKLMGGMGHAGNTFTMAMLSSDAEIVKKLHAEVDAKAAPPAKK